MRPEDEPLQGVAAGEAASAPSAFIIATRNRPEHLEETVRSVTRQSVLPSELCIVDSSDEAAARDRIEDLCGRAGVRVVYDHPAEPGLPRQRNRGMDLTTGDPVVFVDDDVLLEPTCHA
ncbi:MAG: glycosyltransferase family 2 protein, partial [Actinomycetota bacterium]